MNDFILINLYINIKYKNPSPQISQPPPPKMSAIVYYAYTTMNVDKTIDYALESFNSVNMSNNVRETSWNLLNTDYGDKQGTYTITTSLTNLTNSDDADMLKNFQDGFDPIITDVLTNLPSTLVKPRTNPFNDSSFSSQYIYSDIKIKSSDTSVSENVFKFLCHNHDSLQNATDISSDTSLQLQVLVDSTEFSGDSVWGQESYDPKTVSGNIPLLATPCIQLLIKIVNTPDGDPSGARMQEGTVDAGHA